VTAPGVIAVTGASGFTGEHVVRELAIRYPATTLRCLVRPSSSLSNLDAPHTSLITGDLRDAASLRQLLRGADVYVHVASLGFDWTEQVIAAVKNSGVPRCIFFSTTAIFTKLPVNSKPIRERAEELIRNSDTAWTILRPTMIYGTARDRNVSRLIRFVRRMPIIPLVAPNALQQPVHVEDVAGAVISVLSSQRTRNRAYNLSGGRALTLREMVQAVVRALELRRLLVTVPYSVVIGSIALYNQIAARPFLTVEQVKRIREDKNFGHEEAASDFGFAPRSFDEGVRAQVAQCLY
jgi:nucleoside-diphosphate-sugar epimerase